MNAEPPSDDLSARIRRYFDSEGGEASLPDRYELLDRIGEGGMGVVFRYKDKSLDREVAVKVARSDDAQAQARFVTEARVTGRLEHPNVVPVHELGTDGRGLAFFAMKKVEGRNLEQVVDDLSARLPRLLQMVLKVCDAVAFAHSRGVIHRDLKPANVMVGDFGEVLVMDWGLAKVRGVADAPSTPEADDAPLQPGASIPGEAVGSPAFMSPEQALGDLDAIDERTDVFGIGAILHYVLTGSAPHGGSSRAAVLGHAARGLDPVPLAGGDRRVPRELEGIVRRAMAPRPEDRYPSVPDLAADVNAYLDGRPGTAWRDPLFTRIGKLVRRRPAASTAVAGTAILTLVAVVAVGENRRASAEERAHRLERERREVAERAERDRAFLESVFALRDRHRAPGAPVRPADFDTARGFLAAFADRELLLDGDGDAVAAALAEAATGPEMAEGIRAGLYALLEQLGLCGIGYAWHLQHGDPPSWTDAARERRWRGLAEEHPDLVAFWPRLHDILAAHDRDPTRRMLLRAWHARWLEHRDDFGSLLDEGVAETLTGEDLEWLGRLLGSALTDELRDRAVEVLDLCIAREPGRFWARLERARLAHHRGTALQMLRHAEAAFALRPDSATARMFAGIGTLRTNDAERAVRLLSEAVELRPDHVYARTNLGVALLRSKRFDEAVAAQQDAVRLSPDYWLPHYNLGTVLLQARDFPAAEEALRSARDLDPDNPEAVWNLGVALRNQGYYEEALTCYREGDRLGTARGRWRRDAGEKIDALARVLDENRSLLAVLAGGEPHDVEQALRVAGLGVRRQQLRAASRVYRWAFDAEPDLLRTPDRDLAYRAAACAALAAAGAGRDAPTDAAPRAELRQWAFALLESCLERWAAVVQTGEVTDPIAESLRELAGPRLQPLREDAFLDTLPPEEGAGWRALWERAAELLARIE